MRTLRSKLFISVGLLLLIVAILNDLIPEFRIRRKIDRMAAYLTNHIDAIEGKMRRFTSFLVMYNMIEGAVDLEGVTTLIGKKTDFELAPKSSWDLAEQIVSYNPQIAFLRVHNKKGEDLRLLVQDAPLYLPSFSAYEQGMFWVQIPDQGLYLAIPSKQEFYLLFERESLRTLHAQQLSLFPPSIKSLLEIACKDLDGMPEGPWTVVEEKIPPFSEEMTAEEIWRFLFWDESQWIEKVVLIQDLCAWHNEKMPLPLAGVFKVHPKTCEGAAILSKDIILDNQEPLSISNDALTIQLLTYQKEPDLEILRSTVLATANQDEITIGFSISSMVKKIAKLSNKPIILTWDGPPLGFTAEGEYFNPAEEGFPFQKMEKAHMPFVSWRGSEYSPYEITLQNLHLVLLTPEAEAMATTWFLQELKKELSITLSLSLLSAALISFFIALIMLHRLSRKITEPIALLSHAAEELGDGNYQNLHLPKVKPDTEEVALLTHSFGKMVIALRDRDKMRGVLNKVVSKEISAELLSHDIELGGEKKELTMLFSDIRGFTHSAEHLDPQALIRLLNSYLTQMCKVIDETKGVVDKFVGDEIMALYGAPLPMEDHAIKAITAALLMLEALRAWNLQPRAANEPTFEVGIGIHTGEVCIGNMGAESRQNYTVIGANVNLAARLCGFAKPMQILISEQTRNFPGVLGLFVINPLPPATLKGIDEPVPIYEVTGRLSRASHGF